MSNNNIQFRRGSKQDYDAIKASGTDLHDIYLVGGSQHKDIVTTTGADGQETTKEELKPLSMFVGDEQVQELTSNDIVVTVGNAPGYAQGSTIPAGTPISEIIFNLLSKEINPKGATAPKASVAFRTTKPSGLKYVGTTVTIPQVVLSKTTGYFNSDWSGTPSQPAAQYQTSNEKLTITNEVGYTNYPTDTINGSTISGTGATIVAGLNKRTIGGSYSYTAPTNSPITNLNNTYTGSDATWADGTATASTIEVTNTGVYRIYMNGKYTTANGPGNVPATLTGYNVTQYEPTTLINTYTLNETSSFVAVFKDISNADEARVLHLPLNVELTDQKTFATQGYDGGSYFEFSGETTEHETTDGVKYNVFKWNYPGDKVGNNTVKFTIKVRNSDPYASEKQQ